MLTAIGVFAFMLIFSTLMEGDYGRKWEIDDSAWTEYDKKRRN